MPVRAVDRENFGRRMIRSFFAKRRVIRRTNSRGEPHSCLFIHHRIVLIRLAIPDRFRTPIRRRRERIRLRRRRVRIAHRMFDLPGFVMFRIKHRDEIRAQFRRAVNRSIGIDRRIAFVGGNLVVEISLGIAPIPHVNDDVALDALGSRWLRLRQFAGSDAVRPIAEEGQGAFRIDSVDSIQHRRHRLAGNNAPLPGVGRRFEFAQLSGNRPRRFVAQLMASITAVGFYDVEPLSLML